MPSQENEIFVILLRLKSYLISLVDTPNDCEEGLLYSREYLERKFPGYTEEIISLLEENGIYSDCDIVFDQNIHNKFKKISDKDISVVDLTTLLSGLNIEASKLVEESKYNEELKLDRDDQIKQIVALLMKVANEWINRRDIEENITDFSALDEEEVLRPEEKERLKSLSTETGISYSKLSTLTLIYIKLFVDYMFEHGGNITLKNFQEKMNRISENINSKYMKLFNSHGLDKK